MANTSVIFIIYFGEWPSYWRLLGESLRRNPYFDFVIFGDRIPEFPQMPNVRYERVTLAIMRERFSNVLGVDVALQQPYKICDLRPMFGLALQEFAEGYRFWGYGDNDLVFGGLEKFITQDIFSRHDKIFSRGHLSLYRNTPEVNNMFKLSGANVPWAAAISNPANLAFDEWNGIHKIALANGFSIFRDEVILDVSHRKYSMTRTRGETVRPQTMFYHDGCVFLHQFGHEPVEFAYIHLQKRPMSFDIFEADLEKYLYFTPDRIVVRDQIASRREEMNVLNPTSKIKQLQWDIKFWRKRMTAARKRYLPMVGG